MGLLEVEANQLLRPRRTALEQTGEALVELRTLCLRQGPVGGVADEDVVEAESAFAAWFRSGLVEQALPDDREQVRIDGRGLFAGEQVQYGFARELRSRHCGALEHGELAGREMVEAAHEERVERGRQPLGLAVLGSVREQLLDKERIAPGRAEDPRAQLVRNLAEVLDQRRAVFERERSELHGLVHAPVRAFLEQLRP